MTSLIFFDPYRFYSSLFRIHWPVILKCADRGYYPQLSYNQLPKNRYVMISWALQVIKNIRELGARAIRISCSSHRNNSTFMRNISEVLVYRWSGSPVPQKSMLLPLDFMLLSPAWITNPLSIQWNMVINLASCLLLILLFTVLCGLQILIHILLKSMRREIY